MITRQQLTEVILIARSDHGIKSMPWREIAESLYPKEDPNIAGSFLNKLIKHPEYKPGIKACQKYGLYEPQLVYPCIKCGHVHTIDGICTKETPVRIIIQKPGKRPRHPRLAIRLDDPASAARSIIRNMGEKELKKLIEILSLYFVN